MAKEILPVNFKDDIMSEAMEGRRRYRMIQNPDGTVSFEDTTEYDQVGSQFGQGQINKTNQAVNESLDKGRVIDNINDIASNSEAGYVMGALAGKELNQNLVGLNSDLGGYKFSITPDGKPGYITPGGADTVIPFSKEQEISRIIQKSSIDSAYDYDHTASFTIDKQFLKAIYITAQLLNGDANTSSSYITTIYIGGEKVKTFQGTRPPRATVVDNYIYNYVPPIDIIGTESIKISCSASDRNRYDFIVAGIYVKQN